MTIYEAKVKAVVRQMLREGQTLTNILHQVQTWTEDTILEQPKLQD